MGVEIKIVIPSHLRADRVVTKNAISNAIICVPESQADDYKKFNPECEVVAHPDSIKGLTLKRQWIYEQFPNVFMIDDDIKAINRLYIEKAESSKLTPDEAYDIIQFIGNVAKLTGAYLFGLNKNGSPAQFNELKPISRNYIINGCIGLLEGSKLFFHEKAVVSEDYWITAYNAYVHRYCYVDLRFSIVGSKTFGNPGGCASYRTMDQEKIDTLWLREMFGEAISLKKDTKLAKRKHEFQRTLSIPY